MRTVKQVNYTPVFIDGFMPDYSDMKDGHIYISEQYNVAIHRCLCGVRRENSFAFRARWLGFDKK